MNRFLFYLERKIKHQALTNPQKAWQTFEKVTRVSNVWCLYVLNKADKHYFLRYNREELKGILSKFKYRMRLKKYKLDVSRVYIEKANGKLRPIGSPSLDSKLLYLTIQEFLIK